MSREELPKATTTGNHADMVTLAATVSETFCVITKI